MEDKHLEMACRTLVAMRQNDQHRVVKKQMKGLQKALKTVTQALNRAQAQIHISLGKNPKNSTAHGSLSHVFDKELVEENTPRLVVCGSHRFLRKGQVCGLFCDQEGNISFDSWWSATEAKERWASETPLCVMLCLRDSVDVRGRFHLYDEDEDAIFARLCIKCPELEEIVHTHGDLFPSEIPVFGKHEAVKALSLEYQDPFGLEFTSFGELQADVSSGPSFYHAFTKRTDFSQCVFLPGDHLDELKRFCH